LLGSARAYFNYGWVTVPVLVFFAARRGPEHPDPEAS
jgi:hypothetical protein